MWEYLAWAVGKGICNLIKDESMVCMNCGEPAASEFCKKCGCCEYVKYSIYKQSFTIKGRRKAYIAQCEYEQKKEIEKNQKLANRNAEKQERERLEFAKKLKRSKYCEHCNVYYENRDDFCGQCGSKTRSFTKDEISLLAHG